jgi:hypothetical protein
MDNININTNSNLSREDLKILQKISIGLRGMSFLADNGKLVMEKYLFIDCGEKLDPNNVLYECYDQYSSITGEKLECFASKIDKICFPNGIDTNSSIFDELEINDNERYLVVKEKEKEKKGKLNSVFNGKTIKKVSNNRDKKYSNNDYEYGYDKTMFKLGHLSMNTIEEPFLRDDA